MATVFRAIDEFDEDRPIFLFGAGGMGVTVSAYLRLCGRQPVAFIDSHKEGVADGLPILSLDRYMDRRTARDLIIVTSTYAAEIGDTLAARGIHDHVDASRFGGGLAGELRCHAFSTSEPVFWLSR